MLTSQLRHWNFLYGKPTRYTNQPYLFEGDLATASSEAKKKYLDNCMSAFATDKFATHCSLTLGANKSDGKDESPRDHVYEYAILLSLDWV